MGERIPIGRTNAAVFADVFNIGNQGLPCEYNVLSGPSFGVPQQWSEPPMLRVGVRLTF